MSHTILLMQPNRRQDSRSYADFESGWFSMNGFGTKIRQIRPIETLKTIAVNEAMEGVCKIYEEQLKKENSSQHSITYDISQLFDYIDNLTDLSGMFSADFRSVFF